MITFDCIDSTNRWTKEHAAELDPTLLTCIRAREQTAGYGRRGTHWVSPKGNLYITLFFCLPESQRARVGTYTQLLALACAKVLDEEEIVLQIKWPNDLFFEGKKCGGILTECLQLKERLGIVVGLGLNVNAELPPLDQPATSLKEISGKILDLDVLLEAIIARFEEYRQLGFDALKPQIEARIIYNGSEGVPQGLAEDGRLIVLTPQGKLEVITARGQLPN